MVGGFCKPSIKALRNRVLLVAVPTKHMLVAQGPRDVQVPPGTLLGCVRGFDVLQFLYSGHEGLHGSPSQPNELVTSAPARHQKKFTIRGGMRQISGGCVRCQVIATGQCARDGAEMPPGVHPIRRPGDLRALGAHRGRGARGQTGIRVDAGSRTAVGVPKKQMMILTTSAVNHHFVTYTNDNTTLLRGR
jgi:hypothetical protein